MVLKSAKLRLHLLASRTHKWLAIIIGAQLLLWFASGALMSFRTGWSMLDERWAGTLELNLLSRSSIALVMLGKSLAYVIFFGFIGVLATKGFKGGRTGYYVTKASNLRARVQSDPPTTREGISYHWLVQPVVLISDDGRSANARMRLFQPAICGMPGSVTPLKT